MMMMMKYKNIFTVQENLESTIRVNVSFSFHSQCCNENAQHSANCCWILLW